MFSLIITIISIALVAVLALATIFCSGTNVASRWYDRYRQKSYQGFGPFASNAARWSH